MQHEKDLNAFLTMLGRQHKNSTAREADTLRAWLDEQSGRWKLGSANTDAFKAKVKAFRLAPAAIARHASEEAKMAFVEALQGATEADTHARDLHLHRIHAQFVSYQSGWFVLAYTKDSLVASHAK